MTTITHHIRQMSQVLRFAGEHRMFNLAFKTFGTLGLADNHWLIVQRYCHCHFNPGSSSVPLLVRTTLADFLGQSQNSSATTGQCTSGFCRQRKKCIYKDGTRVRATTSLSFRIVAQTSVVTVLSTHWCAYFVNFTNFGQFCKGFTGFHLNITNFSHKLYKKF